MSDELIAELNGAIKQLEDQIADAQARGFELRSRGFGLDLFIKCRDYLKSQDGVRVSSELLERVLVLLLAVGHHGINLGEGIYQITPEHVRKAQEFYDDLKTLSTAQETEP